MDFLATFLGGEGYCHEGCGRYGYFQECTVGKYAHVRIFTYMWSISCIIFFLPRTKGIQVMVLKPMNVRLNVEEITGFSGKAYIHSFWDTVHNIIGVFAR